jgi:nucleoside-diphosphate-sugar epimerase
VSGAQEAETQETQTPETDTPGAQTSGLGPDSAGEPPSALVRPEAVRQWLGQIAGPVAITGGTGLVGSHLVDTLCAAGLRPRVLVRNARAPRWIATSRVELVPGSLGDRESLERLVQGAGTVLHLAGVVRAGRARAFDIGNRQGTANLLQALASVAPRARLVHVSSQAALGPSPEEGAGLGPEAEPRPISAYGRSKLAAERAVAALPGSISWSILRPPAIYGPRDTDVLEMFRMASRGLVALPAGRRLITVAFVADVVRAIVAAAARGEPGRIYHIGEPDPRPLTEMVLELARAGGMRPRLVGVPGPLVLGLGTLGSLVHGLGLPGPVLTRDKARELLARHWSLETGPSIAALGLGTMATLAEGAAMTWTWYRTEGWLR